MSQLFDIHATHPQIRLIRQAVDILMSGGVIVYPTDSCYALGCCLDDKKALDRIRSIRQLDSRHLLTLMCQNLSEIAAYARVDNSDYRLLKALTPGSYTFLLQATSAVPRRLMHPKRKTIGLRVPDNRIVQMLLEVLGAPIMSTSLKLPGDEWPMTDPLLIRATLEHQIDGIIAGGHGRTDTTSVIDMTQAEPQVIRAGSGDVSMFAVNTHFARGRYNNE